MSDTIASPPKDQSLTRTPSARRAASLDSADEAGAIPTEDALDADGIVRLLYQAVLKREADAEGLAYHAKTLNREFSVPTVARLIRSFAKSQEARYKANVLAIVGKSLLTPVRPVGDPVRHILSIGSHCVTSSYLKRFGLKRYSGPFDWIFSSLPMVTHCIEDDFSKFLDARYYRKVPFQDRAVKSANVADHMFYRENFGVKFVFNHQDVTQKEAAAYFTRCVDRFRHALQTQERTILLGICRAKEGIGKNFEKLVEAVTARSINTEVLVIVPDERGDASLPGAATRLVKQIGSSRLVAFENSSRLGAVEFADGLDGLLVARVLNTYPMEKDWSKSRMNSEAAAL